MRTHVNDFSYSDSTSKGIEKSGIEALSRALSMRRMIAFTASGTTMEYGRPAWVDLVNTYIRLVERNFDRLDQLLMGRASRSPVVLISDEYDEIWEEFVSLFERIKYPTESYQVSSAEKKRIRLKVLRAARKHVRDYWDIPEELRGRPDFVTTFLSICEDLAIYVIENDEFSKQTQLGKVRNEIANQFAKTSLWDFHKATLDSVFKNSDDNETKASEALKAIYGKLGFVDPASASTNEKVLKKLYGVYYERKAYDSSGIKRVNSNARIAILCHTLQLMPQIESDQAPCFNYKDLLKPMFDRRLDPLSVIYKDLEIRRFLTLNFDIEIERMLATHYANKNDTRHASFLDFLKRPVSEKALRKPKRDLTNGLQQAVRSATIGESNLGDLFTFGAFPANFDSLVFHLHGRVDDPENMVITQMDYERLYLNSTNMQRSFEEARHAVFNGSDILFVGTGLNESDVIAPLRDFTARHRQMDDVSGQVYALLSSSTSKKYRGENIGLAQTLYKNYGVYTIFIDGAQSEAHKELRKDRYYLEHLVRVLSHNQAGETPKAWHVIDGKELTGFVSRIKKHEKYGDEYSKSLKGREIEVAFNVLNEVSGCKLALLELSGEKVSDPEDIRLSLDECHVLQQIMNALLSRIRSRALEDSLQALSKQRIDWWKRWKSRPEHRVAYYAKRDQKRASGKPLLWVRQQADYLFPEDSLADYFEDPQRSYFSHRLSVLAGIKADTTLEQIRVKRVVAPKGAGKGSIVRFLSQPFGDYYPFEFLFCQEEDKDKNQEVEYAGGFFAHLTFTLEFTSTIFALVRFIIKAAGLEGKCKALEPQEISSNEPDRHSGLWLLSQALSELRKADQRVFICLSGLYRLVDEEGDAYSPVHREFFRILTRSGNSIDLLLLALGQKYPIRYLSHEVPSVRKDVVPDGVLSEEKLYDFRRDRKVWLKHWDKLPPAGLERSIDVAIFVAEQHFCAKSDCDLPKSEMRDLTHNYLSKHRMGSDWSDLIDFIQERIVYIHIVVRLMYWYSVVNFHQHEEESFKADLTSMLGRLAVIIGQGSEQDLMRQLIVEYRRLDHDCLMKEDKCKRPPIMDFGYKIGVDVFDVIMRHLALFNYPVQPCVLLSCPDLDYRLEHLDQQDQQDEGAESRVISKDEIIHHALSVLVVRGFVVRVEPCCSDDVTPAGQADKDLRRRYILHRDAAEVVTRDMNYISQYSVSAAPYQSTFYCAQVQARRGIPSVEHFNFVSNLLSCSLSTNHAFTRRKKFNDGDRATSEIVEDINGYYKSCAIIRGAYAILRGSFSIGAVSRLGQSGNFHNKQPYQAYRSWLQDIINSAVGLSEYRNRVRKARIARSEAFNEEQFTIDYNQPFYRDEVAWLYNEYAVVSFMQGRLFDSKALYNQAIRVLIAREEDDEDQSVGAPRRRIQINLALTEIELGNIRDASILLDKVMGEVVIKPHGTTSVTLVYARGYRALCDHLTGNLTQAEKAYRSVIDSVLDMRQLRAASIFKRHLADLLRVQGRIEEATKYLLLSEKTATQSQQEDILHYTLIARARLMRDLESRSEALQILRQTEDYAKAMGLQKMLAETLKVRAEVMLAEGEVTQAGKMAAQAVAISKRNGMRLRKISAALLQAKVCAQRKQIDFAKQILDEIDQEASELGYTLKSGDAQKFRQSML